MLEGKNERDVLKGIEISLRMKTVLCVAIGFTVKTTLVSIFFHGIKQGNEITQVKGNLSCF